MSAQARFLCGVLAAAWLAVSATGARAVGVPAGTQILNTATVNYVVGGAPRTATSPVASVTVAETLDVDVTLQTAGEVPVAPGDTNRVLAYRVTNTGNGIDTYTLAADSNLLGDDFDPALVAIHLDGDGDGVYTPGNDPQYVPGTNDPTLDANDPASASITVFVLNDIPGALGLGLLGTSRLTGTSNAGIGAPGTLLPGAGDGGIDAVIGAQGGDDDAVGGYRTAATAVEVIKSSSVLSPGGGSDPVTGATIVYRLVVRVTGSDTVTAVVVTDPVPAETSYVADSMALDGNPLTDADDAPVDGADFGQTAPNTVTVRLGDLAGGGADRVISFEVTIN
jgi:uncharacterized repeat protein (TIGR01451 family)